MSGYILQMSADSKTFIRGSFKAPMGVCLCFDDPSRFEKLYANTIVDLFEKFSLEGNKDVYSSTDISGKFGPNREEFLIFLESFVTMISNDSSVRMNVVYTTLSTSELPQGVMLYGRGRYPRQYVPVPNFLSILSQYYPYICAWIICQRAHFRGRLILLDNMQGEITNAWNELVSNHTILVYPSGDLCSIPISASDLCVRYIDEKLFDIRSGLRRESLEKIITESSIDAITHYVGHDELDDIRPIEKRPIPLERYYVRPMIYILKERIIEREVEYIRSRKDLMENIEKYAWSVKGGLKFIDYSQDYRLLRDGDHVICLGPRGKEQAEYLNNLGWNLNVLTLDELMRK